jgi:hypothetical protein
MIVIELAYLLGLVLVVGTAFCWILCSKSGTKV